MYALLNRSPIVRLYFAPRASVPRSRGPQVEREHTRAICTIATRSESFLFRGFSSSYASRTQTGHKGVPCRSAPAIRGAPGKMMGGIEHMRRIGTHRPGSNVRKCAAVTAAANLLSLSLSLSCSVTGSFPPAPPAPLPRLGCTPNSCLGILIPLRIFIFFRCARYIRERSWKPYQHSNERPKDSLEHVSAIRMSFNRLHGFL